MRISKKILEEQMVELHKLRVECPYCEKVETHVSLHQNVWAAKCSYCRERFVVDHDFDDYSMLQSGYCIVWDGKSGTTVSDSYIDSKDQDVIDIMVNGIIKKGISVYEVDIDRKANKENWKEH